MADIARGLYVALVGIIGKDREPEKHPGFMDLLVFGDDVNIAIQALKAYEEKEGK